jgi:peptidoglycan/LPS O-acetylase OafA/YrhL
MEASSATDLKFLRKPRSPRYRALDFWRGVACLMVIIYHSTYYLSLQNHSAAWKPLLQFLQLFWVGVPFFFVISGYCIAATVDSARRKSYISTYFARRFRRIYPPFWIFLALFAVPVGVVEMWVWPGFFADAMHPINNPLKLTGWQWLGNLTLTESWRANLVGSPNRYFMGHAWTLCYEEQFYLVMGVLLLLFPRRLFAACAVVTLLCFLARHVVPGRGLVIDGFFFDGHWTIFAAGILVYYQINYARRERLWIPVAFLIAGILYSLRRPLIWFDGYVTDVSGVFAFTFALALLFLHRMDEKIATLRVLQPITVCGTMCYSLYLMHWPVVKIITRTFHLLGATGAAFTLLVTVPLCMAASVWCGRILHIYVERKFLNSPPRTGSTPTGSTSDWEEDAGSRNAPQMQTA